MSASPWAVIGFILLISVMWGAGSPASVMTGVFLIYAPSVIAVMYLWDKWQCTRQGISDE